MKKALVAALKTDAGTFTEVCLDNASLKKKNCVINTKIKYKMQQEHFIEVFKLKRCIFGCQLAAFTQNVVKMNTLS